MAFLHTPVRVYFGAIGAGTLLAGALDVTGMGLDVQTDDYLADDSPNGVGEFTSVGFRIRDVSGNCGYSLDNWTKLGNSAEGADDQDINLVIGKGANARKLVMKGKVTSFNLSTAGSDKTGRIDFTIRFNPQAAQASPDAQIALVAV